MGRTCKGKIKMIKTNCENCGMPISCKGGVMFCEYCGTNYGHSIKNGTMVIDGRKYYLAEITYEQIACSAFRDMNGNLLASKPIVKRTIELVEC